MILHEGAGIYTNGERCFSISDSTSTIPFSLHFAVTSFPIYIHLGRYRIQAHTFFEAAAYFIAFPAYLSLRRRFGDPIPTPVRWALIAAAVAGAALGSKLLFWFEDPELTWHNLNNLAYLMGGKTIVGALVFGLVSVELIKRYIGVGESTGDLYAIPLALGIAVGRIGCFLAGLSDNTYGTSTTLPWAINFGDGIPRHPTQLYEIAFLLFLIPILYRILKRSTAATWVPNFSRLLPEAGIRPLPNNRPPMTVFVSGDAFKFFMVAYLSFRLVCDFIKPYATVFLGLEGIQWACLIFLLYYSPDIVRWLSSPKERR